MIYPSIPERRLCWNPLWGSHSWSAAVDDFKDRDSAQHWGAVLTSGSAAPPA